MGPSSLGNLVVEGKWAKFLENMWLHEANRPKFPKAT